MLGLVALEDEDDEGACALGEEGVVTELLELDAGGVTCGAIVTDVDEDEGGCELDAEGPGTVEELLELDGAESARGVTVVELLELDGAESARGVVTVVEDDEDEVLPGAPAGPGGP